MLEICCFSYDDIQAAERSGAQRIELCCARGEGGLTPSFGLMKLATCSNLPVMVMIRPHGGDFCYSQNDIAQMCEDIAQVKAFHLRGVVLGALTIDGQIDIAAMGQLLEAAKGLEVCFHRAFDMTKDPIACYQLLAQLGVSRVLTSGQQNTAVAGLDLIIKLLAIDGPTVMVGGGVRAATLPKLLEAGVSEFHSSASVSKPSNMRFINRQVFMGAAGQDEYQRYEIAEDEIVKMRLLIDRA
ncbi:copper homeostasis protein CutC [Celerinatantimonas diazotrophica]|uniref:PF03932 family protein CutC n=1 Tax=Celerinatantimonas diazotrophica TaxID=412034 RepID=A0A4R1JM42_9GAMM|nr:copper homeostasis protein CutC [Celerinatantimonas diazotrophica]TCK52020.1 copper homeostasis protein [Celerinatantimonas diazotrophica]CAG9296277.1 Copper homeostasis protein CutC [Celerinatantimonas diazotrophica]